MFSSLGQAKGDVEWAIRKHVSLSAAFTGDGRCQLLRAGDAAGVQFGTRADTLGYGKRTECHKSSEDTGNQHLSWYP